MAGSDTVNIPSRSMLFVGGEALEALPAALGCGADILCIDLEDAVRPHRKDAAREAVLAAIRERRSAQANIIVRVNSLKSLAGVHDVLACLRQPAGLRGLLLPKVDGPQDVRFVSELADEAGAPFDLYAIIETNDGLENCRGIATASRRLRGLAFGGFDLSAALGCAMDWEALLYARSRVVHAGSSAGIEIFNSPYPEVGDLDGVKQSTSRGKRLGMTGRVAKQKSHVPVINAVYTPTGEEIAEARRILESFDQDGSQSILYEGKLIELPSIKSIRKIANYGSTGK